MSLRYMVTELVLEKKGASAEDLLPILAKHGYTRTQIMAALANSAATGVIRCDSKSQRGVPTSQRKASMYYPVVNPMEWVASKLPAKEARPMVSSVFDLGNPKAHWPDPPAVRKINTPLGPWNTEGA